MPLPWRGFIFGSVLALWIAGFTYFNDLVIRQPMMTGNLLPPSVYGLLVVAVLGGGAWAAGRKAGTAIFSRADLGVMLVIALTACAWPGSNYFRTFAGVTGNPVNLAKTNAGWQEQEVLSYVPGGSPRIAPGQVRDWRGFAIALLDDGPGGLGGRRGLFEPSDQRYLEEIANIPAGRGVPPELYRPLLRRLNLVITQGDLTYFYEPYLSYFPEMDHWIELTKQHRQTPLPRHQLDRVNRGVMADYWFQGHIDPVPPGSGVLLSGGQDVPGTTGKLISGSEPMEYRLSNVPWSAWWPVLRLWVGAGLLIALSSVCLAVIVHPQWSRNEVLPYPLIRFVEELTKPDEQKPGRPAVLTNRLFWGGLLFVVAIHTLNGFDRWYPSLPSIPLRYRDFEQLRSLFPNAFGKFGSFEVFNPNIYLTIVAFSFFIRGDVSFSLGITGVAWIVMIALFAGQGIAIGNNYLEPEAGSSLRAGAYLGFAAMIFYLGRRYYLQIAATTLFLKRPDDSTRSATWAGRGLLVSTMLAVALLSTYGGLEWWLALAGVGVVYIMLIVIARMTAEAGVFYIDPSWLPMVVFSALFGFNGIKPESFVVLAMISTVLIGNPRESFMAFAVHAMYAGDRLGGLKPGRSGWLQAGATTVAMVVAGVATLLFVNTLGMSRNDVWSTKWHPELPFNALTRRLAEAENLGQLDSLREMSMNPDFGALGWLGAGVVLVVGCALCRLYIHRWPLHPVFFLALGSTSGLRLGYSFLLGWAIRLAVLKLGGTRAFHATLPLAVGVIAGELLSAVLWQGLGLAYYLVTGQPPESKYSLMPG